MTQTTELDQLDTLVKIVTNMNKVALDKTLFVIRNRKHGYAIQASNLQAIAERMLHGCHEVSLTLPEEERASCTHLGL